MGMCVCLYVTPNKEKYWADFKNSFFPTKVWTAKVTWAILKVSPTTPSCRKPQKLSKNGVFRTSKTVLQKVLARIRRKLAQWCKRYILLNMEKNNQIRPQRRAAGTPKKRK